MHPCGLVVSPQPLTELVPVQRSPKGPLVAQYDMDAIEDLGFIKIDLLGQAGLSVLRDTVAEVQRTEGRRINLVEDVDYAEPQIWEMIATGGARGVHHIESPAMTSLLAQCNCRDIDCLTAIVALIRPGAANQGRKSTFARRYQGFEPAEYAHPSLESVLSETYGLMVFEEHILHVAVEFAGMNLGRADVLRRALNKQKRGMIVELKKEFFESARCKGRSLPDIKAVWGVVERFCGFMFNKAHSAEYAVEALQGAWLKRRWPAHFLAAILSNYRGFYAGSPTLPQILYVLEARRLGIALLPPDVNRSREHFAVEYVPDENEQPQRDKQARTMIRIPVSHIKGLSEACLHRYLKEREKEVFASPEDFLRRCRPGPTEGRLLLDSGALDGFKQPRPTLFWKLRRWARQRVHDPVTLWDERDGQRETFLPPVELSGPDRYQLARREQDLLGFPVTVDPLSFLGRNEQGHEIDWSRYVPVSRLPEYAGKRVRVCGLMVADRMNATPTGDLMMFVTLADHTGFVETILFPQAYRRFGHLTVAHPILAATGVVEPFENGRGVNLRIQHLSPPVYVPTARNVREERGKRKKAPARA
jgi:DNA polymerase-3 subunit alpha/error-prone DNA polymerase